MPALPCALLPALRGVQPADAHAQVLHDRGAAAFPTELALQPVGKQATAALRAGVGLGIARKAGEATPATLADAHQLLRLAVSSNPELV
jgi:hypothetical protein